jgi:predicted nucleic acid-binding protein
MITEADLMKAIRGRKLLIDSNIVIYLTDLVEPYQNLAKQLFAMVEGGEAAAVISILTVGEVMQGPIRQGEHAIALAVKDYLINFPNMVCQEITLDVLDRIGKNEGIGWKGLRIVDSLIIASGLANRVDLFVSNDRHFKKAIPESMLLSFD